jgi:2-polyprenyl-6-methoxyphenol hydroxylase-like FAD-dependent oxidoreductase
MTSWDLLYHLLRANFDSLQSSYCEPPKPVPGEGEAVYDFGHTLKSLREDGATIDLEFENKDGKMGTTSADLVIAADGPSSTVRELLAPQAKRRYAGYVGWRGTVPEDIASAAAKEAFVEKMSFYHSEGIQILA